MFWRPGINQTVVGQVLPEVGRQIKSLQTTNRQSRKTKGVMKEKRWSGEERTVKLRLSCPCLQNSVRGSILTSGQASPGLSLNGCICRMVMWWIKKTSDVWRNLWGQGQFPHECWWHWGISYLLGCRMRELQGGRFQPSSAAPLREGETRRPQISQFHTIEYNFISPIKVRWEGYHSNV